MGALDQLKFSGLSPDQVDQLPPTFDIVAV